MRTGKQFGDFTADGRLLPIAAMAVPIGAMSTLLAWLLLKLIALATNVFFFNQWDLAERTPQLTWGLATILVPVAGGLIIGLMARFGSERIRGHGIPEALEAILFGKSILQAKVALLKPLSSAISIGSGGPFGAEGPIIMTGGAVGSLFSQFFTISAAERKTLLVAGSAAGMTAVFSTPVAAILLAAELMLFEWRPRSLIPVAVACAVALLCRPYILSGNLPLFPVPDIARLASSQLLAAFIVGLGAGALAWLLSTSLYRMEDAFAHLPFHWSWWPAIGGLVVGLGGYLEPRALGVGYDVIAFFLRGEAVPARAAFLMAIKGAIWIVALASGTSGGVLAPLLIMGAGLGGILAPLLPGPAHLWPLVAMTAVMGGMMRSPFTAIIFALELTERIHALPALLIATMGSYWFTVLVMKRSILTEKIVRRGFHISREYGVDPLERLRVGEIMTRQVETVAADARLADVLRLFDSSRRKHRGYPIVGIDKQLVGIVTASDMLEGISDPHARLQDKLGQRLMITTTPEESCKTVAERMATTGVGRLPVVTGGENPILVGIVTRSDLLKARHLHCHEENVREGVFHKSQKYS